MPNKKQQISGIKIKQVFLILLICVFIGLIGYNISMFIPSLLGAVTLYIIFRKFDLYLIETKKWKSWAASLFLIFVTLVIVVLPTYFIIDLLVGKLGNAQAYIGKANVFIDKIHDFILKKTNVDILSKDNVEKLKTNIGTFSTKALSTTFNTMSILTSMYFILYFLFDKPRVFERILVNSVPLKRVNINKIGEKFRKLVIANAVGIPVVALGQGLVALIGYLIFGAPSPVLLFALTAVASMIPIVGAATIYIPVGIYMLAEGNTGMGIGLMIYSLVAVGLTDNILRFTLLKKLENIHPLNTVFGIIMGMNLFGFMGLVFGPILVSMTLLLLEIYHDEFSDDDTPKLELPESIKEKEPEEKIDLSI